MSALLSLIDSTANLRRSTVKKSLWCGGGLWWLATATMWQTEELQRNDHHHALNTQHWVEQRGQNRGCVNN